MNAPAALLRITRGPWVLAFPDRVGVRVMGRDGTEVARMGHGNKERVPVNARAIMEVPGMVELLECVAEYSSAQYPEAAAILERIKGDKCPR